MRSTAFAYQACASGQSFEELQPTIRAGKFLPDSVSSIGLPISVKTGPSAVQPFSQLTALLSDALCSNFIRDKDRLDGRRRYRIPP